VTCAGGVTVIREQGARERYQLLGPESALVELWRGALTSAVPAGADAWELLDIEAGIADIGPALADQFLPQMLNLDRVGGVSFDKGCYVGQEIVARTHYLGRLKRRLYRGHADAPAAPRPGESLAGGEGEPAGQIVNAQPAPGGGYRVLAVIPIDVARGGAGRLHLADGTPLALEPLPYAIEDPAR
ncbi:MAG: folate-binding protein, partial [Gammaproteobacteria bacterium]|nr:folate-binding protein [Gammaproteobacteria bacterium]